MFSAFTAFTATEALCVGCCKRISTRNHDHAMQGTSLKQPHRGSEHHWQIQLLLDKQTMKLQCDTWSYNTICFDDLFSLIFQVGPSTFKSLPSSQCSWDVVCGLSYQLYWEFCFVSNHRNRRCREADQVFVLPPYFMSTKNVLAKFGNSTEGEWHSPSSYVSSQIRSRCRVRCP